LTTTERAWPKIETETSLQYAFSTPFSGIPRNRGFTNQKKKKKQIKTTQYFTNLRFLMWTKKKMGRCFSEKKLKGTPLQGTKVALSHSNWRSKI